MEWENLLSVEEMITKYKNIKEALKNLFEMAQKIDEHLFSSQNQIIS